MNSTDAVRTPVVILGAGFGGLSAATALAAHSTSGPRAPVTGAAGAPLIANLMG